MSDSEDTPRADTTVEPEAAPQTHARTEAPLPSFIESVRNYGIFTLDTHGDIRSWSAAAEGITGFPEHEVLGRDIAMLHPPEDLQRGGPQQLLARAEERGRLEIEGWRLRKDGSRFWAEVALVPVRDDGGHLAGFAGLICNLTARQDADDAQRRLTAILEATPDLVMFADLEGHILYANVAARRLLQDRPESPLPGRRVANNHPAWATALLLREGFPTAIREGTWRGETAFLGPDGREIPSSQVLLALRSPSGALELIATIARDISEQRRTEDLLRFVVEGSRALTASLDSQMTLENACRISIPRYADWCAIELLEAGELALAEVAHVEPVKHALMSELRGRRVPLEPTVPVGPQRVSQTGVAELVTDVTLAWLRAALRDEEELRVERELGTASLMLLPLVARGHTLGVMTLGLGKARRWRYDAVDLAVAEDLAGRIAIALDNARLYQQVQQAVRAREELLAVVSHDLRAPLNTVALTASVLLSSLPREETQAPVRGRLELVKRATEQKGRLIQDLLDVTQLEAGHLSVEPHPFDLTTLLREVCETFQPLTHEKAIQLGCEVPQGLPPVLADRDRTFQVLSNLVGNALKFTPESGQVKVRAEPLSGEMRLSVADTGPGIPAEQLPHLFEPFWQARHADRGGVGLGLAIARGIVEAHGKRLWVESQPGAGSTFFFTLPTADASQLH